MKEKLVLVGNGMAGAKLLEELLALAPERYEICVFGEEPYGNYNRIQLSPVLAGEKTVAQIMINDLTWYAENGIRLLTDKRVVTIDRLAREVIAEDGTRESYDRLILATGSLPIMLPLPGRELPGVVTFRDIKDVETMVAAARRGGQAAVIGGGLLGLEAAYGLLKHGMKVTVVHNLPFLMNRQLDEPSAALLRQALEARSLEFRMSANTEAILGEASVTGLRFAGGEIIPADLVVMAVGIRPNHTLAKASGLDCQRGVVVDAGLCTSDPSIYALGECVEFQGEVFGLVAPLYEQARILARRLAGEVGVHYQSTATATKLKVTGVDLFSAGDFFGEPGTESIVLQDPGLGQYRKLVLKDQRIVGAVIYGDTSEGSWYFQLMKERTDISAFRDALLFGQAYVGAEGGGDAVAQMADSAEVCGCNGVCKGTIVSAIQGKGLSSLDEVRAHTKASSSCGSCTGLVESLLKATLGDSFVAASCEKPLCPCTEFGHESLRELIKARQLKSIPEVIHSLGWKHPDGCHVCRPALNFYLLAAWPGEYVDDSQSRFSNERVHANIQKDNTYTVVPRIWGGVTNAGELRAIADCADKYQVPMVKITGGQRIDLVGVQKEQLPLIWKDLTEAGFVSGHAYGKALRTVKTCIGKEFCRFGTQNSTEMGIQMERFTWGSWTPAKVKMAVSGCPRNCAEATIKDFGVVAVESGWELHVGGNGGMKVRACDFLTKVETAEEVMEYCGAFMQLYREEGRYNERTAPWIERVGIDYLKRLLVEDQAGRLALYGRFIESQREAQRDPWAERVDEAFNRKEFIPVKELV